MKFHGNRLPQVLPGAEDVRGGGSGYAHVEFSEDYEIILRPDATFVACYSDELGTFKVDGEGREALEEALEKIDDLRDEEEGI